MPLCDGFETGGGSLDASIWTVVRETWNTDASIGVTVDSTVAHRGKYSVKVVGGNDYSKHIFVRSTAPATLASASVVFGRFYVRLQTALTASHIGFMLLHETAANLDLRMGGQGSGNQGVLMWNRQPGPGDPTLPSMSPVGISKSVPLPTGDTWTCIEFRLDADKGTLHTWVNGDDQQVPGLQADGDPTPDLDAEWLGSVNKDSPWHPRVDDLRLGWEPYGGGSNTLWFDDVAFGATRIGCY
jgi:hypothetical protein